MSVELDATIVSLLRQDIPQVRIAATLGISQSHVNKVAQAFVSTVPLAESYLDSQAYKVAQDAVRAAEKDGATAVKLLHGRQVLKNQSDTGNGVGIQIFIGMSANAIGPTPFAIDVVAEPDPE